MHRRSLLLAAASAGSRPRLQGCPRRSCWSCSRRRGAPPARRPMRCWGSWPAGAIALAWHVDYWDGLGWRDPYASRLATERQRAYADRLGSEVFTPGLVVDGRAMLVGSDRSAVQAALAAAPPLPVAVALTADRMARRRRPVGDSGRSPRCSSPGTPPATQKSGPARTAGGSCANTASCGPRPCWRSWDGSARKSRLPSIAPGQGATVLVQGVDLRVLGAAELAPL